MLPELSLVLASFTAMLPEIVANCCIDDCCVTFRNLESVKSRLVESTYTESVKENDNDRNVLEPGTLGSVELDDELAVDWRFCRTPSDYGGASPDHLTVLQDSSSSSTH